MAFDVSMEEHINNYPALPPIERPHLRRRILGHVGRGPIALVAPAGYGKTTLLYTLMRHIPHSAIYRLGVADQDVAYLEARLMPLDQATCILLDDVHLLEEAPQALEWLAARLTADTTRWILSGRWLPSPLAHLLRPLPTLYLTEHDLALSADEVLFHLRPFGYTPEQARAWHARTRGWPLAIAALTHLSAPAQLPQHVEVSLETYLQTHIFRHLWKTFPDDMRAFLSLTSVALQFSIDLAAHLWRQFGATSSMDADHLWRTIVRRRLFVEPGTRHGFWRYHELFRAFLRSQVSAPKEIARQIVAWFHARKVYDMAIEQALADGLWEEATKLLLELPMEVIWDTNRVYTYRRWILGLPREERQAHPILLTRLGAELCASGDREEGWRLVEEGARWMTLQETPEAMCQAYRALAQACLVTGRYTQALEYAHRLRDLATEQKYRRSAAVILSNTYAVLGDLPQARRFYRESIAIAEAMGDSTIAVYQRENLAGYVLAPMGLLDEAERLLTQNRAYYETSTRPSAHIVHLEQWAALYAETGAWKKMQPFLEQIEQLVPTVEAMDRTSNFWRFWLWALAFIGTGAWDDAEEALAQAASQTADRPDRLLYLAQLRAWLARRRGSPHEAVRVAEEALAQPWDAPLARALVALERDIAATDAFPEPPPLHPETRFLMRARALPSLIRLRALLAWRCHREGRPEARRHLRALLGVLRRFPRLRSVLTDRDPDLGAHLWRLALLLGEDEEMVVEAWGCIGQVAALSDLLAAPDPDVRRRTAAALAATRREEVMPLLYAALKQERHRHVRGDLNQALEQLEAQPPPRLQVHFFGEFRVWRGEAEIPADAWPRPAVVRLFQYFIVHRRHPLTRDKIIADLWPNLPPKKAQQTLRRLLSWLRQVLEPYMRPKGPFRYVRVSWNVYTFDPHNVVWVDAEHFEHVVRRTLRQAEQTDVPSLPDDLLTLLKAWKPPVGVAPYEDWWLRWAERWQQVYVDGCLYVAEACLVRREERQAVEWSDRALAMAPWLEIAYQVKMRALARLGRRAEAMMVYEEACAILQQELGMPPSDLTTWLAERLRRGEDI